MDLGLKGKVAIALAASKGLGRASATALAAEGAAVVIGARSVQVLEETARHIQSETGSRVVAVPTDVTKPEDLEVIVAVAVREFGYVDILVNNAGGPPPGTFEKFGDEQWLAAFELNLLSAVRMIRLVLPHMRKRGSGRIVGTNCHFSIYSMAVENVGKMWEVSTKCRRSNCSTVLRRVRPEHVLHPHPPPAPNRHSRAVLC